MHLHTNMLRMIHTDAACIYKKTDHFPSATWPKIITHRVASLSGSHTDTLQEATNGQRIGQVELAGHIFLSSIFETSCTFLIHLIAIAQSVYSNISLGHRWSNKIPRFVFHIWRVLFRNVAKMYLCVWCETNCEVSIVTPCTVSKL